MAKRKALVSNLLPVSIFTDGSWLNRLSAGGWSCLMVSGPYQVILYDGLLNTTINRMELMAVIAGLYRLNQPCQVTVYADSQLTCNIINGWANTWERNGYIKKDGQPVANQDMIRDLYEMMQYHKVKAVWVKAHTQRQDQFSLGNAVVDAFARTAAQQCYHNSMSQSYLQTQFPNVNFHS